MSGNVIISLLSQKGGVGKSTLACLLATELLREDIDCVLVDLDQAQTTSQEWGALRGSLQRKPDVPVISASSLKQAQKLLQSGTVVMVDTPGSASKKTLEIAVESDLIILPASISSATLRPQLALGMELAKKGVQEQRIAFLLNFSKSEAEEAAARRYIRENGSFYIFDRSLPYQTAFVRTVNRGLTISEVPHESLRVSVQELVKEFHHLTNKILSQI